MKHSIVKCPGCGLLLPNRSYEEPLRFHASGECMELYHQLSVYTSAHGYEAFIHQLALDAYGAQHCGGGMRPITAAFSLIGLYLVVERGFTGRQVQQAHMELGRLKADWPELALPPSSGGVTVQDVLQAEPGAARDAKIQAWVRSEWDRWAHVHDWVKEAAKPVLPA
ncbi:DUF5946 family protein [Paenibacillus sacheonensis]|uniref:Serine/threonine protein kinase n=1 Tax=Paenibacillus sacheonensis TaxID=742054 RepID=A0A7X5C3D6_9BACL|nr:DUF5946 family protein [Paenibacillus sacheonensis]MBM7567628.1 hypothetical protein [Paenibacillus sacheonensis]NBC71269.1 serine/threonine protein kinase [Paenibacillus sacheonensis]